MSDNTFSGRRIVVTGAGGSLGAALCRQLVSGGGQVVAVDRNEAEPSLQSLQQELGKACEPFAFDVTQTGAWSAVGEVHGAALIAGGWSGGTPFHETDPATVQGMLDINYQTAQRSLHAVLPGLVERSDGSVVVVGAKPVERPWEGSGVAAYAASKAAVVALAQAVAAELVGRVRVNAVLPSLIDTPPNRSGMPQADFSKWVSLDSLAGVIAFLLSDAARDITGAAIPVYGQC